MADEFVALISAELDTEKLSKIEKQLIDVTKDRKIEIDVELKKDIAKTLAANIKNGLKNTKIDAANLTKQLAESFNITDKSVINQMRKQLDTMLNDLSSTFDGQQFDFGKSSAFYTGMEDLSNIVMQNAKVLKNAIGIYDEFFNYFKNKKIYISNDLKKALGEDEYKELLKNNVGKITTDIKKGISIDSLWPEMSELFPEHFSKDIINQCDQIQRAFEVLKQARGDIDQLLPISSLKGSELTNARYSVYEQVLDVSEKLSTELQKNIIAAKEQSKNTFDIDVAINTDKIIADINNAVKTATVSLDDAVNIRVDLNDEEIATQIRSAIGKIASGDEPVKVDINVNRQSLQTDIEAALNDIDLPVHFKVDADEIEADIRKAVENITDIEIDLRFNTDVDEVRSISPAADTDIEKLLDGLNKVNMTGREGKSVFQSLGNTWKEAFSAYSMANILQDTLYKVIDAGKDAIDTIKELNDINTDLQMATGLDKSTISKYISDYNTLGKEIGALTSEVSTSADTFLRQGRSIEETNQLIRDSMVLSKVAKTDSEQSAEILTATINGFKMTADEAGHINDVLTSIDLNSASSAEGIGAALTKTASMANNAGVSLEKTAAIIAGIKDVTQDSDDAIGNSVKSILSRMNQIKAGKFVDAETGEALNDVEKVLNKIGVSMRDENNQFKDSELILDNVAQKWNTLDKNTQKAVATAMAGTYQYNKLIAMFDNYDKVLELTDIAKNADGTALEKFNNSYLTSLEAKTNSLKASLEGLYTSLISDDLYAGVLDGTKAIIDFVDQTNILKGALVGLGTAGSFYLFQQLAGWIRSAAHEFSNLNSAMNLLKASENIGSVLGEDDFKELIKLTSGLTEAQMRLVVSSTVLGTKQKIAILTANGMSAAQAKATLSAMGLGTAEGAATTATFSLSGAFKGLWTTLKANPLILIAAGVTAVVSAYTTYKQHIEEVKQATLEAGNAAKEEATNIRESYNAYSEANSAYQANTGSKEELESATESLLSVLGVEQAELENLIKKYGSLNDAINNVTTDSLKSNLSDLTAGYQVAVDELLNMTKTSWKPWESSFNMLNFSTGKSGVKYADVLKDAGLIDSGSYGSGGGSIYLGDNNTLEGIIEIYDNLQKMREALEAKVGEIYSREELRKSKLYQEINNRINSFSTEYENVLDYINQINKVSAQLNYIDLSKTNGIPKTKDEFQKLKQSMMEASESSGQFVGSQEQINDAITNTLASIPELSQFIDNYGQTVEGTADEIVSTALTFEELKTKVTEATEAIKSMDTLISSQATGITLSAEDFDTAKLNGYSDALEYHNGVMRINADRAREIAEAQVKEQKASLDLSAAQDKLQYARNIQQMERYQNILDENGNAVDDNGTSIFSLLSMLEAEQLELSGNIDQYSVLTAAIEETTNAYSRWQAAQNSPESGDMFRDAQSAMKALQEGLNNGKTGTKAYEAAVEFLIPDADKSEVSEYMSTLKRYLSDEAKGVNNFLDDAIAKGLMTEDSNGYIQIAAGKVMQDFVDELKITPEMAKAIFGLLEEYDFEFDFVDLANGFDDAYYQANQTITDIQSRLDELSAEPEVNADEISALKEQLTEALELKSGLEKESTVQIETRIDIDDKLDSLQNRYNKLLEDKELGFHVNDKELAFLEQQIQELETAKEELGQPTEMQVKLYTDEIDAQIADLKEQLSNLTTDVDVTGGVGSITSQVGAQVAGITSEIKALQQKKEIALSLVISSNADEAKAAVEDIDNTKIDDKNFKVTATTMQARNSLMVISSMLAAIKDKNVTVTANYKSVGFVGAQAASGNGAIHGRANGSAKAKGDYGTHSAERNVLIGEAGPEMAVDTINGKWRLYGQNGPEMISVLPKGSIIYNAAQTAEILNRGFVNWSGLAHINGTAYGYGTSTPIGGGYRPQSNSNATYNGASSSSSLSSKDSIDSAKESAAEFEEELDHIVTKINRIERAIKNIQMVAESAFEVYTTRNNALKEQISAVTEEISIQQKGYERYLQAANEVGLSEDYAAKIRNGLIDLETITDETLYDSIQKYKDYYEKALDCSDAVNELKESVRELYQQEFDNLAEEYDNILNLINHRKNILEGYIDQTEAQGYIISQKYYTALIANEEDSLNRLTEKREQLIASLNNAMENGKIEEYSDAWYEMQDEINSVNEAIQESNTSIIEFGNSIRDIQWDIFDKIQNLITSITDESDFLINLMSSKNLFDDKGNITEYGKSTMGLHGVNYNTYMSQADEYFKEMQKIESELASDPYNQTLIERRRELLELQQESILAAEDEKQAIKDLVEDGINKQLNALKDLIQSYTDMLDSQSDMYNYQKQISEKQKEINAIEKQLVAYKGDDSEEGAANRQKLQNQFDELKVDLAETQYDKSIAEQKKLLDELYSEYETVLNMRLDNIDVLIADVIGNVNNEASLIRDTLISEADSVGYQLTDTMNTIWGSMDNSIDGINGTLNNNTEKITSVLSVYGTNFTNGLTSVQAAINSLKVLVQDAVSNSDTQATENIETTNRQQEQQTTPQPAPAPTPEPAPATDNGNSGDGIAKVGDVATLKAGQQYYSSSYGSTPVGNLYAGVPNGVVIDEYSNAKYGGTANRTGDHDVHIRSADGKYRDLGWVRLDQLEGYASGTPYVDKDKLARINEKGDEIWLSDGVLTMADGSTFTPLQKGDKVFDSTSANKLWEIAHSDIPILRPDDNSFANILTAQLPQCPVVTNNATSVQNENHLVINIDRVTDYEDLVKKLQGDRKVLKFFQEITLGQAVGHGKLEKNKYRYY